MDHQISTGTTDQSGGPARSDLGAMDIACLEQRASSRGKTPFRCDLLPVSRQGRVARPRLTYRAISPSYHIVRDTPCGARSLIAIREAPTPLIYREIMRWQRISCEATTHRYRPSWPQELRRPRAFLRARLRICYWVS
jgi:hypothetical protein